MKPGCGTGTMAWSPAVYHYGRTGCGKNANASGLFMLFPFSGQMARFVECIFY